MKSAWKQTNVKPEELDYEELPTELLYLWAYFIELHRVRASNGFGPVPISYGEIDAWQRISKQTLDPWELKAILAADARFLTVTAKHSSKDKTNGN